MKPIILIVDDDRSFVEKITDSLDGIFRVEACHSEDEFREMFSINQYDLIIMDMRLKENREGLVLLKEVFIQDPMQPAIIMTAYADIKTYIDALEMGAITYLDKNEISPALIARTVEAIIELGHYQKRLSALERHIEDTEPTEIIGYSPSIIKVRHELQTAALTSGVPVIISGESGTGKRLVARNIHMLNRRRAKKPFVFASCDRFGSKKTLEKIFGSSTRLNGKLKEAKGLIDEAKEGVLLLSFEKFDESVCKSLVSCIESDAFSRVGSKKLINTDLQIMLSILASDQNRIEVKKWSQKFGHLNCVEINAPPLRERKEDIPLIAQYILQRLYRQGRTQVRSIRGSVMAKIEANDWKGNVRELKIAIEHAAIMADSEGTIEIDLEHIPRCGMSISSIFNGSKASDNNEYNPTDWNYQFHLARAEIELVESAIMIFNMTKKTAIAERLQYNDRFIFSRRIRQNLKTHPVLGSEFPKTAKLFSP